MKTIPELVREAEQNYLHGTTKIGEYVDWSMHDTIETIDAYLNSKHISGDKDSLGRDKPFFNIVTAATNIWYRATDLDRKNIRIMPDKVSNTSLAFIATVLLQNWMKKARFGTFLNQWGMALARYGSAVVKFVERDGELTASVIPWNRFIADPVQFDAIPRIEKFYLTPAQLRKNTMYDQNVVDQLIRAVASRKTLEGHNKDNRDEFIELYEVHGELDTELLKEDPDLTKDEKDAVYRQQMHVVSYVQGTDGGYSDFTLYKGKERRDPYMITHLIEEDGRTLGIGAVEYLFNAQWMANHSMKNMKDTLDLASKLIFQTSDTAFLGRNVLSAIETGDIMIHKINEPLTRIANDKPDIAAFQNFGMMWQNLAKEITATPDAMRGDTPPSGTPYSTTALITQQSNSLFEIMSENKGLSVEDMARIFILPHLMTKMDTKDEIVAILDSEHITELDSMFVPAEAARRYNNRTMDAMERALSGDDMAMQEIQPFNAGTEQNQVRQDMGGMGNKRSFAPDEIGEKTWKDALKDFQMNCIVEVTNENTDKNAVLTTLSSVFQTIAGNPGILQDQNARMVFSAILQETGRISPIQLSAAASTPSPTPVQPGNGEPLNNLVQAK